MNKIVVHKAWPTAKAIMPVRIEIVPGFPDVKELSEADKIHDRDAEKITEALWSALPGGTFDRLLTKMLAKKASHLRVSHESLEVENEKEVSGDE